MKDQTAQKLLEKVKNDYAAIAEEFDEHRMQPWDEFRQFLPLLRPGQTLLDCGCGNGRLFPVIREKNVQYTGMDNSESLVLLARKRHPNAKFVVGDQLRIPFPDASFDHLWNIAALHHVPSKKLRLQALSEMHRVLKPGGLLALTVWNLWQEKYRKYIFQSLIRRLLLGEFEWNDTFIPWGQEKRILRYYHAFREMELARALGNAGFIIIHKFCASDARNLCFVSRK